MSYALTLTDIDDAAVEAAILAPLVDYNNSQAGPGNHRPLVVKIQDAAGHVTGGLVGATSRGWLFTRLLVVPQAMRGQGVGTALLTLAEAEAARRGCVGAWLDTFEFQARGFYEKMGYECFGEIENYPPGYSRFFMKKRLVGAAAGE